MAKGLGLTAATGYILVDTTLESGVTNTYSYLFMWSAKYVSYHKSIVKRTYSICHKLLAKSENFQGNSSQVSVNNNCRRSFMPFLHTPHADSARKLPRGSGPNRHREYVTTVHKAHRPS